MESEECAYEDVENCDEKVLKKNCRYKRDCTQEIEVMKKVPFQEEICQNGTTVCFTKNTFRTETVTERKCINIITNEPCRKNDETIKENCRIEKDIVCKVTGTTLACQKYIHNACSQIPIKVEVEKIVSSEPYEECETVDGDLDDDEEEDYEAPWSIRAEELLPDDRDLDDE